jgi:c-di-AMP phosphodiesterase-like protein
VELDAKKIQRIIGDSFNVIIMAHKNLDLDALGSSLGMYFLCKKVNKNAFLLIEETTSEKGVARALKSLKEQQTKINIKTFLELQSLLNEKSLLVILDVHRASLTQNKDIFKMINNIIVLDHHIKDSEYIDKTLYEYIDSNQSSTSEIVIELLKELDIYIPSSIATIMLAGIVVDTNHFSLKTTSFTHEAASYLYENGAEINELQYLLKEDLDKYIMRQKIINKLEIVSGNKAIGCGEENDYYRNEEIAKIADTMLSFNEVEASFTIARINDETVGISGRSLGNINVQKIMEKFGGGGHVTDAAAQIKEESIDLIKQRLLEVFNQL